jgi:hypothetical protein
MDSVVTLDIVGCEQSVFVIEHSRGFVLHSLSLYVV